MKEDQEKVINCVGTILYRVDPTTGEREFYLQKRFVPEKFRDKGRGGYRTDHDTWEIPCGAIDRNEKQRVAAIREVKEETGIKGIQIGSKNRIRYFQSKGKVFEGKTGDQVQIVSLNSVEQMEGNRHWMLRAVFIACVPYNVKVKIKPDEASEFKWIPENELKGILLNDSNSIFNLVVPALQQIVGS